MFKLKYDLKKSNRNWKTRENTLLTENKVDASTPGHPQSSSTILFHIFLLAGSQEKIKKCLLRHRLPLRLRHLIFQFGRKIKTYVPKNKNKIKVIPHQYKMTLKTMTICLHRTVLTRESTLFF